MAIKTDNTSELLEVLKGNSDKQYIVYINDYLTEIFPGSAFRERKDIVEFFFNSYRKIPSGEVKVKLVKREAGVETILDLFESYIPENNLEGKQPIILGLNPMGGKIGDTVTLIGKNFGNDLDKIEIYFFDTEFERPIDLESTEEQPLEYLQLRARAIPFNLYTTTENTQHVYFSIPTSPYIEELARDAWFRKSIQLKVYIEGRPSAYARVTILPEQWKIKVIALAVFATILGLSLIAISMRKLNFIPYILLDKSTNTYSLSRFQAFVWTIVLTGSYFYIAIAFGILLQNGKIPEFNASLVGLMSISYSGFITSHFVNKRKPKNEVSHTPPGVTDLFMENGVINITRLQLLIFTILSVVIYLYNLYLNNVLNGLPEIPPTLHGLLISSQSGYIAGKIFGDKISVNRINPNIFKSDQINLGITLVGSGFVDGTRVTLEGSLNEPVEVNCSSNTLMNCTIPNDLGLGKKNLVIIPPTGSSVLIPNAIEIV
jgi:hypothetical protein